MRLQVHKTSYASRPPAMVLTDYVKPAARIAAAAKDDSKTGYTPTR
jgi:hypothetical protein